MERLLACGLLVAVICPSQSPLWEQLQPTLDAGDRWEHALAYDETNDRVVLFGGYGPGSTLPSQTWTFDGSTWSLASTTGPSGRQTPGMCYDPVHQQVLLLGGDSNGSSNDFWTWNGAAWQSHGFQPITSDRCWMTYDSVRGVAVAVTNSKTYEWSGAGSWQRRFPNTDPPKGPIAFDAARANTVMFVNGETWLWDGIDWQLQTPMTSPPSRSLHALCYEPPSGKVILFGGYSNGSHNDTWAWNGTTWTQQIATGVPAPRHGHAMTYSDSMGALVMYGGSGNQHNETWKKNATFSAPASATPFGVGCAGSAGVPTLAATQGSRPWLGTTQHMLVDNLFPFPFWAPFGIMGLSNTNWGAAPLPLDLGVVGMPGCELLVEPLEIVPLVNVNGSASWAFPIPNNANVVGANVYVQASVVDTAVNAFGMVWSNAMQLTLGAL